MRFDVSGLSVYVDPYFNSPVDWTKLPKGDIVLFSHGHFDHGVLTAANLYDAWKCHFVGPKNLIRWMARKYKKRIPADKLLALDHHESLTFKNLKITAVPAHHPLNRVGKTIMTIFARSSAPGKPVNGYHFDGYFHSGATIYSASLVEALKGVSIHTACVPIGGKYAIASPKEALRIAEEIGAQRLVPMHWQPLLDQVFFRYQSSDLIRLAKQSQTKVEVCALAIGEVLNLETARPIELQT